MVTDVLLTLGPSSPGGPGGPVEPCSPWREKKIKGKKYQQRVAGHKRVYMLDPYSQEKKKKDPDFLNYGMGQKFIKYREIMFKREQRKWQQNSLPLIYTKRGHHNWHGPIFQFLQFIVLYKDWPTSGGPVITQYRIRHGSLSRNTPL